jgi:hypothetical protein
VTRLNLRRTPVFPTASHEYGLRYSSDTGQRLTAKTQCRNLLEVRSIRDLARRMARKGRHRILRTHTLPIVNHCDQGGSRSFDLDLDVSCASVESVLDQLLDHRSWPFHHLASRDLIGHGGR